MQFFSAVAEEVVAADGHNDGHEADEKLADGGAGDLLVDLATHHAAQNTAAHHANE